MRQSLLKIAYRAGTKPQRPFDAELPSFVNRYLDLKIPKSQQRPHDRVVRLAIEQSFLAANLGNFAVGAIIVTSGGTVMQFGHSRVLRPYLRTDLHAEMTALNELEDKFRFGSRAEMDAILKGSTLVSSLEPCPMCFTRWISSGISNLLYAVPDQPSGMSTVANQMPSIFQQLIKDGGKSHGPADCSPLLSEFALELFTKSRDAGRNDPAWGWK